MTEERMNILERFSGLDMQDAIAEIRRLRSYVEELENVINAPYHVAVFDEDGWALEHSMECRLAGEMTKCVYNRALDEYCKLLLEPQQQHLIDEGRWILTGINKHGFPEMQPQR